MHNPPKTATLLLNLLDEQHTKRSQNLFKKGTFTLSWRAKVGSTPFPNVETLVSAAEPCGRLDWRAQPSADSFDYSQRPPEKEGTEKVPEYFGSLSELAKTYKYIPLNGYIPGSAIRGIVRSWAMQQSANIRHTVSDLLGKQNHDKITPGKIEFLDAWPEQGTSLSLDVVNPQEKFQVYHDNEKQPAPHAFYTLGDGSRSVPFTLAIRGIPSKATDEDVDIVWQWLMQALAEHGLGGRTASGYGLLESAATTELPPNPNHQAQRFDFTLYTQGIEGAIQGKNQMELRPSHWRGWLRSWTLRFLLGVMSENNAKIVLEELFGTIESTIDGQHRKGCVRVQLLPKEAGHAWGELSKRSNNSPDFYIWKGQIQISAPQDILESILLPIIKIATSVGGVGRGWRRPLHFFVKETKDGRRTLKFSRGTHLILTRTGDSNPYQLSLDSDQWDSLYTDWCKDVQNKWGKRGKPSNLSAEVFSRKTCAVYAVPGPTEEPIDFDGSRSNQALRQSSNSLAMARPPRPGQRSSNSSAANNNAQRSQTVQWVTFRSSETRGRGMNLIYSTRDSKPSRDYKGNPQLGGKAAGGPKSSFCSWASIRRVDNANPKVKTQCQEIVCLFMGGVDAKLKPEHVRSKFLQDLARIPGSIHLFGQQPPTD